MARVNSLDFDEMVSDLSKKVCVQAESLGYINESNIVGVMNGILPTYQMSAANQARWNNMNPRLRSQHVLGAMNWDCNNIMMTSAENGINDAVNAFRWSF